ncbi:2924_t:CDS:2, partial [Funneliformis mosseae]
DSTYQKIFILLDLDFQGYYYHIVRKLSLRKSITVSSSEIDLSFKESLCKNLNRKLQENVFDT